VKRCRVCSGVGWVEAAPVGVVAFMGWDNTDEAPQWERAVTVPCWCGQIAVEESA
jgi:hypothetical protein